MGFPCALPESLARDHYDAAHVIVECFRLVEEALFVEGNFRHIDEVGAEGAGFFGG